jgi:two-component system chemotaxis sensor kinase CheA
MAMDELVKVFMEESEDEIRELESGLIRLEEHKEDEDTINRVFRAAHTLIPLKIFSTGFVRRT